MLVCLHIFAIVCLCVCVFVCPCSEGGPASCCRVMCVCVYPERVAPQAAAGHGVPQQPGAALPRLPPPPNPDPNPNPPPMARCCSTSPPLCATCRTPPSSCSPPPLPTVCHVQGSSPPPSTPTPLCPPCTTCRTHAPPPSAYPLCPPCATCGAHAPPSYPSPTPRLPPLPTVCHVQDSEGTFDSQLWFHEGVLEALWHLLQMPSP